MGACLQKIQFSSLPHQNHEKLGVQKGDLDHGIQEFNTEPHHLKLNSPVLGYQTNKGGNRKRPKQSAQSNRHKHERGKGKI